MHDTDFAIAAATIVVGWVVVSKLLAVSLRLDRTAPHPAGTGHGARRASLDNPVQVKRTYHGPVDDVTAVSQPRNDGWAGTPTWRPVLSRVDVGREPICRGDVPPAPDQH